MFYASGPDDRIVDPQPNGRARCPLCRGEVIAKCGPLVEWHWAHMGKSECDSWSEAETPWHRWWKERAPMEWREVVMGDAVKHRADIRRPGDGYVIELQHSPISVDEIRQREVFYRRMVWLLDGRMLTRPALLFENWVNRLEQVRAGVWLWLWPRRSFRAARKKVFIDLGTQVIEVARFEAVPRELQRRTIKAPGFYVHGTTLTRAQFITRAHLSGHDQPQKETVSFIAEWRVPALRTGTHERTADMLRRREFRTQEGLRRWILAKERPALSIMRWLADGSLEEAEVS